MTQTTLAEPTRDRLDFQAETIGDRALVVAKWLRPADGWAAVFLLAINLIIVVWSVDQADWVPTPSLVVVLLLGMVTGLVFSRLPLWGILAFPMGLALGVLAVVWQMTSFSGVKML